MLTSLMLSTPTAGPSTKETIYIYTQFGFFPTQNSFLPLKAQGNSLQTQHKDKAVLLLLTLEEVNP